MAGLPYRGRAFSEVELGAAVSSSPAFGQADLTNFEREQIHLAGSIQPHGMLLVLREPGLRIVQASATAGPLLGRPLASLLLSNLRDLGSGIDARVREVLAASREPQPQPFACSFKTPAGDASFEGTVHRTGRDTLVLELEPVIPAPDGAPAVDVDHPVLLDMLRDSVRCASEASSIGILADVTVRCVRDLVGYDRVMVYRFDPDGHGRIIAEARDPRLEPLLGHRYPATDIPQRARELYLRTRVRVLRDAHYQPSPLLPHLLPGGSGDAQGELDMSLCYLRSMSPLHLQYLQNMGVTATLVISLVREGKLWGLIACHHYTPRNLRFAVRAACELLGEVISTRIAAIENYARTQMAIQVRRLEQRLVEATSTEGDWRLALFRNQRTLLQPLDATGAVLFHEGEILSCGEVPSTAELRELAAWIAGKSEAGAWCTAAIALDNPALARLTSTASGVLAVRLSSVQPDLLIWLRKEQLQSYTWAGDPNKPIIDNDPLKLSPRRSFAAWSEIVRGTAVPWTQTEIELAEAFGESLIDIIVQVHAVRLLIAEHQLAHVRATVAASKEAVIVAPANGATLYANDAFLALAGRKRSECTSLDGMVALFDSTSAARQMIGHVRAEQRPWRGELVLSMPGGAALPVSLRAEPVPARDGSLLGFIFIFGDLTHVKLAQQARIQLEASLSRVSLTLTPREGGELIGAIVANASLAAMDISDGGAASSVGPLLREVEIATARAATLFAHIRSFGPLRA
jgi:PAS domain S-box-containing protein